MNSMKILTLVSTIAATGTVGEDAEVVPSEGFILTGGTVEIFDKNGAVLPNLLHDEITVSLKIEGVPIVYDDKALSAFTLKKILESDNFIGIPFPKSKKVTWKATHVLPSGHTAVGLAPFRVRFTGSVLQKETL